LRLNSTLALAAILAALGFEFFGGHAPCPLCLTERYAYYVGVPLLFLALVALAGGHPVIAATGFFLVALAFLANMGVGGYHTGAEWGFWPGPSTCSGALQPLGTTADLLKGLKTATVIRCDQASWWLFGLSFAGWNTVLSTCLWITSWQAGRVALRSRLGADSVKSI
jgi:disulfide bond formation protein DsbB